MKSQQNHSRNLHLGILRGDFRRFSAALAAGADPNLPVVIRKDAAPLSPLQLAARHGCERRFVEALLAAGADVHYTGEAGRTAEAFATEALAQAVAAAREPGGNAEARWHAEYVRHLLRDRRSRDALYASPPDLDLRDERGRNVVHWAAHENDGERLRQVLAAGGNPEALDSAGATPLHTAARQGAEEAVAALLENDSRLNWRWNRARDALPVHTAIDKGRLEALRRMLEADDKDGAPGSLAQLHTEPGYQKIPLMRAVAAGFAAGAELLVAHGADVNAVVPERSYLRGGTGHCALAEAARSGDTGMCRLLLDLGADVNRLPGDAEHDRHNVYPRTVLECAIGGRGNAETVKLILAQTPALTSEALAKGPLRRLRERIAYYQDPSTSLSDEERKAAVGKIEKTISLLEEAGPAMNARAEALASSRTTAAEPAAEASP